jgi:type I restriction enzyme S subunit
MADDWKETPLGAVIDVKHGFAFPGENIRDEPPGNILLSPGNFAIGGGFKGDKFKYFDGDVPEDYVLNEGDLLVTMTDLSKQGDTLGYPAIVPRPHGPRFLHNQRLGKVIIKPGAELDRRFLFYLLRTAEYRHEILASATGTTVRHTSPGRILAHKVSIPLLDKQKAIASVLGALDDKIELNRRINETLEALAQGLFKSWFVDATENNLPKGWRESRLGDLADVTWGDTNTTKASYSARGFPAYSASGCDGFLPHHDFDRIGVVVSAIGANAGVTWLALGKWSCIKNTIRFWATDDEVSTEYLFYATLGKDKWPLRGSAQPFIAQGDARAMKIIVPSNQLAKRFGQIVEPFHLKIGANKEESRTLATLRDALLPKLLSGELRVPAK